MIIWELIFQNRFKKTDKTANGVIENNNEIKSEKSVVKDPIEEELGEVDLVSAVNAKKRTFTEMCRDACSLLRAVNKKLDARDEFQVFGEHVAMKLRSLKSELAKNVAQYHINNILFEAITGKYDTFCKQQQPHPQQPYQEQQHSSPAPSGQTINSYMSPQESISPHHSQNSTPYHNNSPGRSQPSTSTSESFSSTLSDIYSITYDDFIQ